MIRHLANAHYLPGPAGGNTGWLFLSFCGPVCADQISNCPLDRVLTYKNLICLLDLQYCPYKNTLKRKLNGIYWLKANL